MSVASSSKRQRSADGGSGTFDVTIERLALGGSGIARHGGRTLLVPGVCSGERVRVVLAPSPKGRGRPSSGGELAVVDVVVPSPDRVAPVCPYVGACGGCDFMHVAHARQLEILAGLVRDQLEHATKSDVPAPTLVRAPRSLAYRTRARLAFHVRTSRKGSVEIGYRRSRSHELVAIDRCAVLDPRLGDALDEARVVLANSTPAPGGASWTKPPNLVAPLRGSTNSTPAPGGASWTKPPNLVAPLRGSTNSTPAPGGASWTKPPNLVAPLRGSTNSDTRGELAIALGAGGKPVLELHPEADLAPDAFGRLDAATRAGRLAGARVFSRGASAPIAFGDPRLEQTGADGAPLHLAPGSFAQPSDDGAVLLAARMKLAIESLLPAAARERARVVELFSGSGTLTVTLAGMGFAALTAVELDRAATVEARVNLAARGATAHVVCADAETHAIPTSADLVVLDPPRTGARGATAAIIAAKTRAVVYVSCDPATLARDVGSFASAGYAIRSVDVLELFPQTSHVETIVALELARAPRPKPA